MSYQPTSPGLVAGTGCVQLAAAIRSRKISVTEVMEAHLDRVARRNGTIGAIIHPASDVLQQAAAADRALARGDRVGPLHGVPFTVKDTLAVAGYPATAGSAALAGYLPKQTAPVVRRILDAGAILLGKANCSEFAVDTHAGNLLFGDTRNPLDEDRTPGGSSGGDAAAVASGMAAFGLGTDFGGSVRWPAHCTGVASFRPTIGRLPGTGILPYDTTQAVGPPNSSSVLHRYMTAGPIAWTVADLELLTSIMAGPDGQDQQVSPTPIPPADSVDPTSLRVAWCEGEGTVPVRADVRGVIAAAAEQLRSAVGAVRHHRPPRLEEAADLFVQLRDLEGLPEVSQIIRRSSAAVSEGITAYLGATAAGLAALSAVDYAATVLELTTRRDAVRAAVLTFMEEWPVLLLPVASVTAPIIGTTSALINGQQVPWSSLGSCCRAISILALPAAVVPFGTGDDGMPVGVQVVGRPFHDHEVLAVAQQLEVRRDQLPPGPALAAVGASHQGGLSR